MLYFQSFWIDFSEETEFSCRVFATDYRYKNNQVYQCSKTFT